MLSLRGHARHNSSKRRRDWYYTILIGLLNPNWMNYLHSKKHKMHPPSLCSVEHHKHYFLSQARKTFWNSLCNHKKWCWILSSSHACTKKLHGFGIARCELSVCLMMSIDKFPSCLFHFVLGGVHTPGSSAMPGACRGHRWASPALATTHKEIRLIA